MEFLPLILNASPVVQAIMGILLLLSLFSWLIIFRLMASLSAATSDDGHFMAQLSGGENLPRLMADLDGIDDGAPFIFTLGYQEYLRLIRLSRDKTDILSGVERSFRTGLGQQQSVLERGLPTLASVASVAPYVGLLGTVWGIMTAFIALGEAESVSLATVAPSIAEALIATAMGLFAAIPASLAFNHFSAKATAIYDRRALLFDEATGMIYRHHLKQMRQTERVNR